MRKMHAAGSSIAEVAKYLGRSPNAIGQQARKRGLRFLRPGHRPWTAAEKRILRRRFPNEPTADVARDLGRPYTLIAQKAHALGLRKNAKGKAAALARISHTARTNPGSISGRFKKGLVPANKGLRRPGWSPGRMAETQFRKGERQGVAVKLWKPVGTERISADGYLERKVNDGLPLNKRWRGVHLIVWEQANGPLPAGHVVRFKDGMFTADASLITLDRLECLSRGENMRRNSIHNYPPAIKDAMRMRGVLNRAIRKTEKRNTSHG